MIGMSSRFQVWRVRHRLKWWWNKACSLSDESLVNRCISRPMDTCGQNKAMEISAADVPWSEGQNPKLVRSFSPQNLKNMDLEKNPNPSWGWFPGSPNPKHHLQWRRYKIIEIIPWPMVFIPIEISRSIPIVCFFIPEITPMSWFFDGNHQIFRSKSRWKPRRSTTFVLAEATEAELQAATKGRRLTRHAPLRYGRGRSVGPRLGTTRDAVGLLRRGNVGERCHVYFWGNHGSFLVKPDNYLLSSWF